MTPGTVKGKRRLSLVLVGLVLVVGSAAGFWFVIQRVDERQSYVAAARTIERWERVTSSDFRIVEANIGDASALTVPEVSAVFGFWATGRIPEGTLVTAGMFAQPPLSGPDEADRIVIQVSLPADEVTFGALESGDRVALIGREGGVGGLGLTDAVALPQLSLLGVLHLDFVQGGNIIYVVEPVTALQIQNTVSRYNAASDRQIWRLGIDLTAADVERALRGEAATLAVSTP